MLLFSMIPANIPPKIENVRVYFSQRGMTFSEADHFFLWHEKREWKTKKGEFLKNWKNSAYRWISVILKEEPWRFNRSIH